MNLPAVLPEAFLRCLSPEDRKSLAVGQLTLPEATAKATTKFERDLQSDLVGLLRLRGIEPLWFRTDKRTRSTVGWPDITFAVDGRAIAWEAKLDGQKPRPEQTAVHCRMIKNGWTVEIVTSVEQGQALLNELGTVPATD